MAMLEGRRAKPNTKLGRELQSAKAPNVKPHCKLPSHSIFGVNGSLISGELYRS